MELSHIAARQGRLSSFLKNELGLSTGLINRLKWHEGILVNGIPQHNDYQVLPGDVISALLDDPQPDYPAEVGPLTILYEDEYILAVDKPAGMLIHPSRSKLTGTLANRVLGHYQKTGQNCAFHPLTRLDRDTFGIVLLGKNAHIHRLLQQLQIDGCVTKIYHALVFGKPESETGMIDAPIARLPLPSLMRQIHPDGKPSITEFSLLEQRQNFAKLALRPITGRTHQLRLHCAYMNFPILGDPQYYNEASKAASEVLGLHTQMLCAKQLSFPHPVTKEPLILLSSMDVDFP